MQSVAEWHLYPPLIRFFQQEGYHVASQLTDPAGTRWEIDVAAYTPNLEDVRLIEAKQTPSQALLDQCLDRLEMAPRVYAAVPTPKAPNMQATLQNATETPHADHIGLIQIHRHDAKILRPSTPTTEPRNEPRAQSLERVLRSKLTH